MSRHTSYIVRGRPSFQPSTIPITNFGSGRFSVSSDSWRGDNLVFGSDGSWCGTSGGMSLPSFGGDSRFFVYERDEIIVERGSRGQLGTSVERPVSNVLTVKRVDFKIRDNTKAHRTDKFVIASPSSRNPQLVVRRGQPFVIEVEFSRAYDRNKDDLRLVFEAGNNPMASKRTHVEFILSDDDLPGQWGASIVFRKENKITINVYTPPTCFIAKWSFKIDVVKKEDTNTNVFRYEHKNPIYILFNPWCAEDSVYMPEVDLLNEYVLNETGKIYDGSKNSITSKPWNFGQFESCVLDVALYILDITGLNWAVRGNPIPVVRKLSALVNSSDDGGILSGRWDDMYDDGTPPTAWTGSAAILEQYWQTRRPVSYGQCWVFSGVAATLCRALGIPARCVTNYNSAHDTDGSITYDVIISEEGEINEEKSDSIWNFHVWTEAFMTRPDLPPGYGGWQVIDATPQEASDGVYCCGPTSVHAIQQGEVNLPYDGPFVFAEVNADMVFWQATLTSMVPLRIEKKAVGKFISTKAPNSNEREDITLQYKHPEDSSEERAAVIKANLVGSNRQDIYVTTAKDVSFKVKQDAENTWLGGSFIIGLSMRNKSKEVRTIGGRIVISTMYYTGVTASKLKSEPFANVVLQPGEEKIYRVELTQDEYEGHLKTHCMLDVSILAHVEETNQNFITKESHRLHKPHLAARAPNEAALLKEFLIDVSFTNPLNSSLTNCSVTVDGVSQATKYPQKSVPPKGTFTASLPVIPTKVGNQEIIIIFNSKQLEDINTSYPIYIGNY